MATGSIYDDVITRYLLKEADPDEERFVVEWMAADRKNKVYIESLRETLNLVDSTRELSAVEVDKEWAHFRKRAFHQEQNDEPGWELFGDEQPKRSPRLYKLLLASAVAAAILTIIALNAGWFSGVDKPEVPVAKKETKDRDREKIDPLMAVVHHEVNTSGRTKELMLPDGSRIALYNNSELTYKEPVDGTRRNIYLTGKAGFEVAKNKAKPFTVFTEGISTTAVGTVFMVEAHKDDKFIRVKLTEGKVVVRSLKGYHKTGSADRYLAPGQELVYDKQTMTIVVNPFVTKKQVSKKVAVPAKENPSIPRYDKRSWFMFNNQPLNEVFDALAEMYDAKIEYSHKDVNKMYFVGTYDKSDSLHKILNQIALLNDLKVSKQKDVFQVKKQKLRK